MSKRFYLCNLIPLGRVDLGHLEVDWAQEKARDGELVELRVVVKIPLNLHQQNFSVQFEINEEDYLLFGGRDDHVVTIGSQPRENVEHRPLKILGEKESAPVSRWLQNIFVSPVLTQNGQTGIRVWAYWLAKWQDDVAGKPEYYFDFKLIDVASVEHKERSDRELIVSSEKVRLIHSETFRTVTHEPQRGATEYEAIRELSFTITQQFDRRRLYEKLRHEILKGLSKVPLLGCNYEGQRRVCDIENLSVEILCKDCEIFTLDIGIDHMPWDEKYHRIRELNPYVWVTISADSIRPSGPIRPQRLNMGTDLFDDVYFDTPDFICLDNDISIRARKRWASFHIGRNPRLQNRGLRIGVKFTQDLLNGIKQDQKLDRRIIRETEEDIDSLIQDVQGGFTNWSVDSMDEQGNLSQGPGPLVELKEVYDLLVSNELLPDIGPYEDVLLLQPKAFLRSLRSRFHFLEASLETMRELHRLGTKRLEEFRKIFREAMEKGSIDAARHPKVEAYIDKVEGVLDHSLVAKRVLTPLQEIDPAVKEITDSIIITSLTITSLLPDSDVFIITGLALENLKSEGIAEDILEKLRSIGIVKFTREEFLEALRTTIGEEQTASDMLMFLKHACNPIDDMPAVSTMKIIAQEINQLYHELADQIDTILKMIFSRIVDIVNAERFVAWQRQIPGLLLRDITTFDRFAERHEEIRNLPSHTKQTRLAAFNRFGEEQKAAGVKLFNDFMPLDMTAFEKIAEQLLFGKLNIWKRQIEAAGSAALGLWFDIARRKYVPESSRITQSLRGTERSAGIRDDHFLIDTMDLTGMFTPDAWVDRPVSEQTSEHEPDIEKLFNATFINEVQLELSRSIPYQARISTLTEEIESKEENDPEIKYLKENLTGAEFVLDQYRNMLGIIADIKIDGIRTGFGGTNGAKDIKWEPTTMSKGVAALKMTRELSTNQ